MSFARKIGRWSLAGLVINSIIGSSIFGLPSELTRLLGNASSLAVLLGAVATAILMACFAEVASQFPKAGGPYLYARETFGRFVGIQVGWFAWLTRLASAAANVALFGAYFAGLVPSCATPFARVLVMFCIVAVLVISNYIGVRRGANVSTVSVVARLLPLFGLIALGMPFLLRHSVIPTWTEVASPGGRNWFDALLLVSFLYGGYDSAMMPMGEVEQPRRSVPFALAAGLLTCAVIYPLCQQLVVVTIGAKGTERPLADAASVLLGSPGVLLISTCALVSIFGYLAATILNVPRMMFAMSETGDFPRTFAKVHPRFGTPHVAIVVLGALVFLMAATGGFRWAVAVSAGARLITYGSVCAALIPSRRKNRDAFRIPAGTALAVLGIAIAVVLVVKIHTREAVFLVITATAATLNWLATSRRANTLAAAAKPNAY
jgi:amino acid transporter